MVKGKVAPLKCLFLSSLKLKRSIYANRAVSTVIFILSQYIKQLMTNTWLSEFYRNFHMKQNTVVSL